ncbi:Transmembrane protein, partial [Pseudolycoriella hygida]
MSVTQDAQINFETDKYPFCIVWTPIPVLTFFFPFIGHMGIALSNGVIRDFAGPYFVSEDSMAFGRPCRYLVLDPFKVNGGAVEWDECVSKATLRLMSYEGKNWNMIRLAFWMFFCGKYVGWRGAVRTWVPFIIIVTICAVIGMYL